LSNRRVDGGVEIVTALDYDENMARQSLGGEASEAVNGSRLAEMQAERHRRLEDELDRSRARIREVREYSGGRNQDYAGTAFDALPEPETAMSGGPASRDVDDTGYSGELARMRAEISSLRDL